MNEFGFTNDPNEYEAVTRYREAAKADGWSSEPTYNSESEERASTHSKAGFTMHVIARSRDNFVENPKAGIFARNQGTTWSYEAKVNIWGPDGLFINPGKEYGWEKIKAYLRHCPECNAEDVDTERAGFANRVCEKCAPALRSRIERPGWAN